MSRHPWPDHLLSLDEWAALPPFDQPCELAEGVLIVSPRPSPTHQWAIARLSAVLNAQLPDHLAAFPETEVVVSAARVATVRVPDVVVGAFATAGTATVRLTAADVVLACEVVSPGSRGTDRVTKVAEYAAAGIGHYWVVDLEPGEILAMRLAGGVYTRVSCGPVAACDELGVRVGVGELLGRR